MIFLKTAMILWKSEMRAGILAMTLWMETTPRTLAMIFWKSGEQPGKMLLQPVVADD